MFCVFLRHRVCGQCFARLGDGSRWSAPLSSPPSGGPGDQQLPNQVVMQPRRMLSMVLYTCSSYWGFLQTCQTSRFWTVFTAESACLDPVRSSWMNTEELEAGDVLHFSSVDCQTARHWCSRGGLGQISGCISVLCEGHSALIIIINWLQRYRPSRPRLYLEYLKINPTILQQFLIQ